MSNNQKKTEQKEENQHTPGQLVTIFNILGNIKRFRIFRALTMHDALTSGELSTALNISTSLLSKHLKKLELGEVVVKNRSGKEVQYSLNRANNSVISVRAILF